MARAPARAKPQLVRVGDGEETAVITETEPTGAAAGSTQNPRYGSADVKVYPINEDQLSQLGLLRGLSSLCFTLAGGAFGFGINIYKDLQIQGQAPPAILGYWEGVRNISFVLAIVLALVGTAFFGFGAHRLHQIKKNTRF